MKIIHNLLLVFFLAILIRVPCRAGGRADIEIEREAQIVYHCEKLIQDSGDLSGHFLLDHFAMAIRQLGHRRQLNDRDPRIDDLFFLIQKKMLSVPGHAKYFSSHLESERLSVADAPRHDQLSYDRKRAVIFEVFKYLPSPETVVVLCHYLEDERDTPPDVNYPRENSFLASRSLAGIGLRSHPVQPRAGLNRWRDDLAKQLDWWRGVKTGSHTFSFVGGTEKYRILSDGSFEEIAIRAREHPQRSPEAGHAVADRISSEFGGDARSNQQQSSHWIFLAAALLVIIAMCWWLKERNTGKPQP